MSLKKPHVQNVDVNSKTELKLDWCTHEAVVYACKNWHYSKVVPAGKLVKIGVWENKKYIGCVLFSRGANNNLSKAFNMKQTECCELTRVALNKHKTPVSRILSIAIKMLKKQSPKLKLIVSYADTGQGHHGGIYQATNWIYTGEINSSSIYLFGKKTHTRSISSEYGRSDIKWLKKNIDKNAKRKNDDPKHRYLYILDNSIRNNIMKLSKQYPIKNCSSGETVSHQTNQFEVGGSSPTLELNINKAVKLG